MTLDAFVSYFNEVKKKYNIAGKHGVIRYSSNEGGWYCPITLVYKELHNVEYSPVYALQAGRELGLSENSIHMIIGAADCNGRFNKRLWEKLNEA